MQSSDEQLNRASQWIDYWKDIFSANPDAVENAEASFCPPEPASDERTADEDPDFLARCHADVVSMSNGPVVWNDQLLTRSPKWGLVWRADFKNLKMSSSSYPTRVTCWKNDNGEHGMTISGCQYGKLGLQS